MTRWPIALFLLAAATAWLAAAAWADDETYWVCVDDQGRKSAQDHPCAPDQRTLAAPDGEQPGARAETRAESRKARRQARDPAARSGRERPSEWTRFFSHVGAKVAGFLIIGVISLLLLGKFRGGGIGRLGRGVLRQPRRTDSASSPPERIEWDPSTRAPSSDAGPAKGPERKD